jgi:hypothetical protein
MAWNSHTEAWQQTSTPPSGAPDRILDLLEVGRLVLDQTKLENQDT